MLGLEIIWGWGWISFKLYRYLYFHAIYCNGIRFVIHLQLNTIMDYLFVESVCAINTLCLLWQIHSPLFLSCLGSSLAIWLPVGFGQRGSQTEIRGREKKERLVYLLFWLPPCQVALCWLCHLTKSHCFSQSDHFWKILFFQILVTVVSSLSSYSLRFILYPAHILIK